MLHFYKNLFLRIFPLSLSLGYLGVDIPGAIAQLQPDNTLGKENSVVTPNINIKGIESDRIDGGAQRGANLFHSFQEFNIQQGRGVYFSNPDGVQNILTRVTGNNGSNILGTLGVDGKADLFFINPNGIIFGPEAKLDVQCSFYGATADSILFQNGFEFASSDPQAPPLLTVNVPIGLSLPENPGSILVEGQGHNISLGFNSLTFIAKNSRNRGLEVGLDQTLALVGGDIFLRGGNLTSKGGRVELGSVQNGVVGITTDRTLSYDKNLKFGQILLSEESSIDVSGNGRVGFQIQGEEIKMRDSSIITVETLGDKDGGTSIIRASESIKVEGTKPRENNIPYRVTTVDENFTLTAFKNIPSVIFVITYGKGNVGDLTISARNIELGSSPLWTGVQQKGEGQGGNLMVKAESLTLRDGAEISSTTLGQGNAGNLKLEVDSLTLRDGAQISTNTFGQGNAGNLKISAIEIELIGSFANEFSGLFARVREAGAGTAGTVTINTETLKLRNKAKITVNSAIQQPAGNLIINSNNIRIENQASLTAETKGGQGNITINDNKNLILREQSTITTNATDTATGGNITINTENLVASDNSDITANAEQAFGGRVNITAAGIFGTKYRAEQTEKSDITATSALGPSFSGKVNIYTPDVDPSNGLIEFDDTIPDISNLLNQNLCKQGKNSKFIITGKSGLPPTLKDPMTPTYLWQDPETSTTPPPTITPSDPEFIEAQGWISTSQGIELTTNPKTVTPIRPWLIPPNCKQINSTQPQPYLLASSHGTIPSSTSEPLKVTIKQFNFEGNTKLSNEELQQQLKPYINKPITFFQLIEARSAITQYYTKNKYITSGAFIPLQTISDNGTLTIQVVEGKVGEINVKIQGRLNPNYIRSRLEK
ncbi:MAG: filamentous hemagglutinin N-terminal domain-containing protein, partial [Trichodesmium sp. MAG_R04]|nr:filamentous hemagglutinin N-terminal domain-containing protein [Trichodesmium sp. MAG_R04]